MKSHLEQNALIWFFDYSINVSIIWSSINSSDLRRLFPTHAPSSVIDMALVYIDADRHLSNSKFWFELHWISYPLRTDPQEVNCTAAGRQHSLHGAGAQDERMGRAIVPQKQRYVMLCTCLKLSGMIFSMELAICPKSNEQKDLMFSGMIFSIKFATCPSQLHWTSS